jgi:hypothetical protein
MKGKILLITLLSVIIFTGSAHTLVFADSDHPPIQVGGHSLQWESATPTCTEDGYSGYFCVNSGCGYSQDVTIILATGHEYEKETVKPTCTVAGYSRYVCVNPGCDDEQDKTIIPATGHEYEKETVKPTCTEKGYTTYTCVNCGDTYTDLYVEALGHAYGDWIVDLEATVLTEGHRHQVCAHDESHIIEESIPCLVEESIPTEEPLKDTPIKKSTKIASTGASTTKANAAKTAEVQDAAVDVVPQESSEASEAPEDSEKSGESALASNQSSNSDKAQTNSLAGEEGDSTKINALDVILTALILLSETGFCATIGGDLHVLRWNAKKRVKHGKNRTGNDS